MRRLLICGQTISFKVCFCANNTITVSNNSNLPPVTEAIYTITTQGNVTINNNENVTFKAGENIILNDGFEVKNGGIFAAEPGFCIVNNH